MSLFYLLYAPDAKMQFCESNCILYGTVITRSIFTSDITMTEIIDSNLCIYSSRSILYKVYDECRD
jgi:hypothetical protein